MGSQEVITEKQAFEMIAEVFEENESSITVDRAIDTIDGWDSIGILTFMAELDSRFGVTVSTDEFEKLSTINDVLELLKNKNVLA